MTAHLPALQRKLSEIVGEYDTKASSIEAEVLAFEKAGDRLKMAACVGGTWGDSNIDTGSVYASRLEDILDRLVLNARRKRLPAQSRKRDWFPKEVL